MERFVIIINGFQPLTIITKRSILDVAAVLDPPLAIFSSNFESNRKKMTQTSHVIPYLRALGCLRVSLFFFINLFS